MQGSAIKKRISMCRFLVFNPKIFLFKDLNATDVSYSRLICQKKKFENRNFIPHYEDKMCK